jgi:SAM-dependent methyltransferase
MNWLRWFFDFMYRFRHPRWDTGITPPEVISIVQGGNVKTGRALDLGCGTGTNSIYLAQKGFHVVAVDFSAKAIEIARGKARQAGAAIDFYLNDVTQLDFVREPFDLVLDVGCFHGLDDSARKRYASNLVRLTCPGSIFLLYAFDHRTSLFGRVGATSEQIGELFHPCFNLTRVDHGMDHGDHSSTWYLLTRN